VCHVVASTLKCLKIYFQGATTCHDEIVKYVTHFVNSLTWHDMAQTVRHLDVLTVFVPVKWHDLERHIAWHCGNKIRASVRLALLSDSTLTE